MEIKEKDIIDKAIFALQEMLPLALVRIELNENHLNSPKVDGFLLINEEKMAIETANILNIVNVERRLKTIQQWGYNKRETLFIVDETGTSLRDYCHKNQINFIDTLGNCFIQYNNIFLFVERKNRPKISHNPLSFNPNGLLFLLYILQKPILLHKSIKELTEITQISKTVIEKIENELRIELAAIRQFNGGLQSKDLAEKWALFFINKVRPSLHRGYFRYIGNGNIPLTEKIKNSGLEILIGGEFAINEINGSLKPQKLTLYTNERLSVLAQKLQIVPISQPNNYEDFSIEILSINWQKDILTNPEYPHLAPSLIVYTDLIANNSSRNVEVAQSLLGLYSSTQ